MERGLRRLQKDQMTHLWKCAHTVNTRKVNGMNKAKRGIHPIEDAMEDDYI